MKPGDLVRIYTIATTHVPRGAHGILVRVSEYDSEWWVVYVMSEDRMFAFHEDQLQIAKSNEERPAKIDIRKSYSLPNED
mgnify:CR=1 FL=1|tara:strand:+ start:70 stop:309 length:240 start_codon:yes stop_codon:yes gene_type:complete